MLYRKPSFIIPPYGRPPALRGGGVVMGEEQRGERWITEGGAEGKGQAKGECAAGGSPSGGVEGRDWGVTDSKSGRAPSAPRSAVWSVCMSRVN